MTRKARQAYQYEAPVTPSKWTGEEQRFSFRVKAVLEDLYQKFGSLSSKVADAGCGTVKSVNDVEPDEEGNVTLNAGDVSARPSNWMPSLTDVAFLGENPITSTTNDTPVNWIALGSGYAWYTKNGQLINQPYAYGFLVSYSHKNDVFQLWKTQRAGTLYYRGGNGSGWGENWTKVLDETSASDYVVAQGTSGIWSYRKWNSGKAECWFRDTLETDITAEWGNIFESSNSYPSVAFPFTLLSITSEFCGMRPNNIGAMAYLYKGTSSSSPQIFICRPRSTTTVYTYHVSYYVIGTWK